MEIRTLLCSVAIAGATALTAWGAPLAPKGDAQPTGLELTAGRQDARRLPLPATRPLSRGLSFADVKGGQLVSVRQSDTRRYSPTRAGSMPEIRGVVVAADDWGSSSYDKHYGIYAIPTSPDMGFEVEYAEASRLRYSATLTPEFYVGFDIDESYYYTDYGVVAYDIVEQSQYGYKFLYTASDLAFDLTYDASTDRVYGISFDGSQTSQALATYDFEATASGMTYTKTIVGLLGDSYNAIAADKNGELYGITSAGTLVKIDKNNAAVTVIGATGFTPAFRSSACFDPRSNRLFWSVCDADKNGFLCEVDVTTGAATKLVDFPQNQQVIGLYIAAPAAEDGAPAAPANLQAVFPEGTLSGKLTFDVPATTFDGNPATGEVTYTVMANDAQIATGTVQYGETGVEVPYVAPDRGNYKFLVYLTNSVGKSPNAKCDTYIGTGLPKAVASVTAVWDEATSTMTISWPAVTEADGAGFFNPEAITYKVVRNDGTVVAEAVSETTVTDSFTAPDVLTAFTYSVTANFGGGESGATVSNTITLGAAAPPFSATFDSDLCGFTVLDANGDGKEWYAFGGRVRVDYNSSKSMDDWLFTIPLRLEAGKMYPVSYEAWAESSTYLERMEVMYGKSATPDAMTGVLMAPTEITGSAHNTYTHSLVVPETGTYYIGFHGISDADRFYLNLDNFTIGAAQSADRPDVVTDLTATAGERGATTITLTFKAPVLTMAGNALESLTSVTILRGEESVKVFDAPAPGAELSFTDELPEAGEYTYSVYATNADGDGEAVSISRFCGVSMPLAPAEVTFVENATPGNVTVSWPAVDMDIRDNALFPDQVTYNVYVYDEFGDRQPVAEGISELSYTYDAMTEGQRFVKFAVCAVTSAGAGEARVSESNPVGVPYDGLNESFPNKSLTYEWGYDSENSASFNNYNDSDFTSIQSYDGDNGFMGLNCYYAGERLSYLVSGKVSLAGMENPALTFFIYNQGDEDTPMDSNFGVEVREAGGEYASLLSNTVSAVCGADKGWYRVLVPLAAYEGKVIQFRLGFQNQTYKYTYFDCVQVAPAYPHDLAARSISAPAKVQPGADYQVSLTVTNNGTDEVPGYSVNLYADGELVKTFTGEALAASAAATFTADMQMGAMATEPVVFTAEIIYDGDQDMANNHFEEISVLPDQPASPVVTDLVASADGTTINLSWSAPDLTSGDGQEITVDFEDAEDFAKEYGDWTFQDVDCAGIGSMSSLSNYGFESGSQMSWGVINYSEDYPSVYNTANFNSHSGCRYIGSIYNSGKADNNDWAISPEIAEGGQTITFWAASYSGSYLETLKVAYSASTNNVNDFTDLQTLANVPHDWTAYQVELPADAKYFAIVNISCDRFMVKVDDITFAPKYGAYNSWQILGYHIFRDGQQLTTEPVTEPSFADVDVPEGDHTYHVVTVYDKGLSAPSNAATANSSAILGVEAGAAVSISAREGLIVVKAPADLRVVVSTVDGKVAAATQGSANIAVASGLYLVKVGNTVAKLYVK